MLQEVTAEIEETARAVMNELHSALPGKIVSFNASKCTATVKPIGQYVTSDGTTMDYPKITEVPIVFPYSKESGIGIAIPVKSGDSCLIIISEVELDEWRNGSRSEGSLRFDLTSAVAIPGLMKSGGSLFSEANSSNAVVIGAGSGVRLIVSKSGITARGDLKVEGNIYYTGSLTGA